MSALLKTYFDIAFLMGKPQDLPAGESQMFIGIILNFITYVVALLAISSVGEAGLHAVIDIGCTGLFLYAALSLTSRRARFHQALGAICGAGAFLNLAAIPILYLAITPADQNVSTVTVLAQFVLLVWSLSLAAHVLRHTFELHMFTSIGIAVLYYVFITSVLATVFPPEQAGTDPAAHINLNQQVNVAHAQAAQPMHESHRHSAVLVKLRGESSIF